MVHSLVISLLIVASCSGAETREFFGKWTPPASLQEFWKPINESWWNTGKGASPKLDRHCRSFARQTTPERIIPDMIQDLKDEPSEVRWFVYLDVMRNWPQKRVLQILKLFQRSHDPAVSHIANEFCADVE
jgi:hypothetical protein